jgi:hypothetical protein
MNPVSSLSRRLGVSSGIGIWQDVVMPFTLREPALPDAPQIAKLRVATRRETYSHLLPEDFFTQEHVQSRHQMWNHLLGNSREEWSIRIAESRGQIIGFAFLGPSFGPEGQELTRSSVVQHLRNVRALWHRSGTGVA